MMKLEKKRGRNFHLATIFKNFPSTVNANSAVTVLVVHSIIKYHSKVWEFISFLFFLSNSPLAGLGLLAWSSGTLSPFATKVRLGDAKTPFLYIKEQSALILH
jgi:hypothetical protein